MEVVQASGEFKGTTTTVRSWVGLHLTTWTAPCLLLCSMPGFSRPRRALAATNGPGWISLVVVVSKLLPTDPSDDGCWLSQRGRIHESNSQDRDSQQIREISRPSSSTLLPTSRVKATEPPRYLRPTYF